MQRIGRLATMLRATPSACAPPAAVRAAVDTERRPIAIDVPMRASAAQTRAVRGPAGGAGGGIVSDRTRPPAALIRAVVPNLGTYILHTVVQ